MNCHEARDLCSALVDDALSADERATLEAHLDGCAECRRELDRVRQTVALLRSVPSDRAPVGFVDRVMAAARPLPWYRRALRGLSLPFRVRLPLEAAALLLVGGIAVYVFQHTPELQQAARTEAPAPAPARVSDRPTELSAERKASSEALRAPATSLPASSRPASPAPAPAAPEATRPASVPDQLAGVPPSAAPEAKEAQAVAELHSREGHSQRAAGELAKTRNVGPAEADKSKAAVSEEREQKKTARADQGRDIAATPSVGESAAPARSAPARSAPVPTASGPPAAASPTGSPSVPATAPPGPPAAASPSASPSAPATAPSGPPPAAVAESPLTPTSRDGIALRRRLSLPRTEPVPQARQEAGPGSASGLLAAPYVSAVLAVSDRDAALRALVDLVDRAQGRELARRAGTDATVIDLVIPRPAYGAFVEGVRRLGRLTTSGETTLPEQVRVSIRVLP